MTTRQGLNRLVMSWLGLAAALLLLDLSLTFHNLWPTLWVTNRNELSLEVALLLLGLWGYHRYAGTPSRWALGILAVLLTLLVVGRYAHVTAPGLYGRPINLYWDVQHVPAVMGMLARAAPPWQVLAAGLGLLLLLSLVYAAMRWSLARVVASLDHTMQRRTVALLGAALTAVYGVGVASPRLTSEHWFSLPVTPTYLRQAAFIADAYVERDSASTLPPSPLMNSSIAGVHGADVLLVFVESYGATAYDNPDFAAALTRDYQVLGEAVVANGFTAASAFVRSPTFGGASWLAHASLLSGIEVADPNRYALLLTQDRQTLVHRFDQGARHC